MGIDINRVASSALEAALREEPAPRQHHLRGVKTLAAGAALVTAARVGMKHVPRLTELRLVGRGLEKLDHMPNLRDVTDSMRDRFADYVEDRDDGSEDYEDEDYDEDEDHEGDEDEDEDEEEEDEDEDDGPSDQDDEDGPTAESDQSDDDEDSEPEAEDDEESEPEAEDDADDEPVDVPLESGSNGSSADDETPDLVGVLGSPRSRAPLVERMAEGIDPAAQPPRAPEQNEREQRPQSRRGGRSGSNSKAGSNRKKQSKTARK